MKNNIKVYICLVLVTLSLLFFSYRISISNSIIYNSIGIKDIIPFNIKLENSKISNNVEFKQVVKLKWDEGTLQSTSTNITNRLYLPEEICIDTSWSNLFNMYRPFLKWKNLTSEDHQNDTKANYTIIELFLNSPNCVSVLKLTTRNKQKEFKRTGGDWWRITIKNPSISTAVRMQDLNDGTYIGYFILPEEGSYTLIAVLETTDWEGVKDPPEDWYKKGTVQGHYQPEGILGEIHYLHNEHVPPISFNIDSSEVLHKNCSLLWPLDVAAQKNFLNVPCGYWRNNEYIAFTTKVEKNHRNYSVNRVQEKLETFLIYGDSNQVLLWRSLVHHKLCKELFKRCLLSYHWVYLQNTDELYVYDDKDFNETRFLNEFQDAFNQAGMKSNRSVLLINFGLHLIFSLPIERCISIFKKFVEKINTLKEKLGKNCPKIVWKDTTPPMVETTKSWNLTHYRFLTKQRVDIWNSFTMAELRSRTDIPILHVHDMALAYPNKTFDHVHYNREAFRYAEESLYETVLSMV